MRSTMVPLGDIQDLADRGAWLVGDAAHPIPVLGGEGANRFVTDAIGLAEDLSNGSTSNKNEFLEKRHQEWRMAINESEGRLSEMHGLSLPLS